MRWLEWVLSELEFGPVVVKLSKSKSRIGYYDDDDFDSDKDRDAAIVYYCEPPFLAASRFYMVDPASLRPIDTESLWTRRQELNDLLAGSQRMVAEGKKAHVQFKRLYEYSLELSFVNSLLADRMMSARANEGDIGGRQVFISYSSRDRQIATWLSVDLANEGHVPWLDEWQIKAGESIPNKIAHGIAECDYLLVLLSPNSVGSGWVEREWSTKYSSEVADGHIRVIPVLLQDCEIPTLLQVKKYADLRTDYHHGLEQILEAVAPD